MRYEDKIREATEHLRNAIRVLQRAGGQYDSDDIRRHRLFGLEFAVAHTLRMLTAEVEGASLKRVIVRSGQVEINKPGRRPEPTTGEVMTTRPRGTR